MRGISTAVRVQNHGEQNDTPVILVKQNCGVCQQSEIQESSQTKARLHPNRILYSIELHETGTFFCKFLLLLLILHNNDY